MAKGKDVSVRVILECTSFVYETVLIKNRRAFPVILLKRIDTIRLVDRLELRKFCPYCCKHTTHGEIKK
ncbi:hypothetical protein MKX03_029382 [Papaver bracteatum]|nr:hypothetical protein MKX03_029382 [Papaver bracteatum]